MQIKCLATGSKGNCYIVENKKGKKIMLECGISLDKILKATNLNDIEFCLVSHEHSDHDLRTKNSKNSELLRKRLVEVYDYNTLESGKLYKKGDFLFIPLECVHNVKCYGFYIESLGETMLFATDTQVLPKINKVCDTYLIEVNYEIELLESAIEKAFANDSNDIIHLQSVYHNHSALDTVNDYFRSMKNVGKKPNIYTIHSSNSNILDKVKVITMLGQYANKIKVLESGDIVE